LSVGGEGFDRMKFNSTKRVAQSISYLFAGLVVFTAAVAAQTEPVESTPAPNAPQVGQQSESLPQASNAPGGGPASTRRNLNGKASEKEKKLRAMMVSFGVTDLDVQNAIIDFVQDEVTRRQPMREQISKLYSTLRKETLDVDAMTGQLADFRAVVEADKNRRTAAEAALNHAIGYSTNPRLEAMLLLFGIIGDAPTVITMPAPKPAPRAVPASESKGAPALTENNTAGLPQVIIPEENTATVAAVGEAPQAQLGINEAQRLALLERFDYDRDGLLDVQERTVAREFLAKEYLSSGLWPPRPKTPALRGSSTSPRNDPTTSERVPNQRETPEEPRVPRSPGPLPVIPATVVTPPATPAN